MIFISFSIKRVLTQAKLEGQISVQISSVMIPDDFHSENESENQGQISLCFGELPNTGNYHSQTHVFIPSQGYCV
jgi:hypothetical protein